MREESERIERSESGSQIAAHATGISQSGLDTRWFGGTEQRASSSTARHPWGPDVAALLVVIIWGVNFVFVKAAFEEFDVLPFVVLRYVLMIGLGWLVIAWQLRASGLSARIARADLPRVAATGLLGYTCYITLSMIGLEHTTAFSNALLIAVAPLFMAGLLRALGMERILPGQLVAMLIAIAGVFVFMLEKSAAGSRGVSAGDLISLAAAFFFAAYNVAAKPLMARYPATVVTAWALTIGAVPVVLLGLPSLPGQDWGALTSAGWGTLVWSAIFPVYVAWTAWGWVNQQIGVARAAVYMYLVPLVGGVTSWLLLGETFGVQKVAGAALVITGLALARRAGPRPAAAPREAESEQQRAAPRAAT